MDRRLGGLQSRSRRRGEEKILDPTGNRTPTPRSSRPYPVAMPTALSRFLNTKLESPKRDAATEGRSVRVGGSDGSVTLSPSKERERQRRESGGSSSEIYPFVGWGQKMPAVLKVPRHWPLVLLVEDI
jgi:hypothetical protein